MFHAKNAADGWSVCLGSATTSSADPYCCCTAQVAQAIATVSDIVTVWLMVSACLVSLGLLVKHYLLACKNTLAYYAEELIMTTIRLMIQVPEIGRSLYVVGLPKEPKQLEPLALQLLQCLYLPCLLG